MSKWESLQLNKIAGLVMGQSPSSDSYTVASFPPGYAHTDPVWFARKYVQVFRTGTWYRSHVPPSDRKTDAGRR